MSRPWFPSAIVLAAGLATGAWLRSPDVRIDTKTGDWQAVSAGLTRSGRTSVFTAGRRAMVHFHDIGAGQCEVVVAVSSRDASNPARLRLWRDGDALFEVEAAARPTAITVPARDGADHVEVGFEVSTARETARPAWRIHEIVLRRSGRSRLALAALPALIGAVVCFLVGRRSRGWIAVAWGLAAVLAVAAVTVAVRDPVLALRIGPWTRDVLRVSGLMLLWALALTSPGPRAAVLPAVIGTVGILYLPSIGFGFMNEDFSFARPWSWHELLGVFHGSWFPQTGVIGEYYRPLVSLSFAWDSWIWGTRTGGYHLTNLALHAANGLLAVLFLERLGLTIRGALAGALALLAHPLGATAAVWFSERTDGMMALFYLGALVVLLSRNFTRRHGMAVLGLGALALGCKEMAVTLPLTAALAAWAGLEPSERRRRRPVIAALAGLVIAYAVLWAALFPHKLMARVDQPAPWPGFEPRRFADWLSLLPKLYGPVLSPVGYEAWWTAAAARVFATTALGVAIAVSFLRWRSRGTAGRVSLLGLVWPLATVVPILAIREVDLYRLGLLIAVGFGLWWGAAVDHLGARRWWLPGLLAALMAVWLAPPALETAAAWGPGGYVMSLLPGFKRHFGPEWWDPLTPQMKRLYYEQLDRQDHATAWVAEGS